MQHRQTNHWSHHRLEPKHWRWLLGLGLTVTTLTACTAPSQVENAFVLQGDMESDEQSTRTQNSDSASVAACQSAETSLQPLTTPENGLLFEQFNFQPQHISIDSGVVSIKTPYYTFVKCGGKRWAIASNTAPPEDALSYAQYLNLWGDPEYDSIEVDGKTYEYRIRLQADWLKAQLEKQVREAAELEETLEGIANKESAVAENDSSIELPAVEPTDATLEEDVGAVSSSDPTAATDETDQAEEAVYFDLKTPNGQVTSHQLYTRSEVQDARIGASLGVPRIADTVVTADAIWFAATTSQGEGENGFASLLRYDPSSNELTIQRPDEIQGDQITSMVATNIPSDNELTADDELIADAGLTLWLGTMRSGEGNPTAPASGLVAYQPATQQLDAYTLGNSPMVGAIPHRLAIADKSLWVATGNGICDVKWLSIDEAKSWDCWRFTATATLPSEGVPLYDSFLAEESATTLKKREVEVLWAASEKSDQIDIDQPGAFRYEVVYEPGFETTLAQGGYRLDNEVARRMAGGDAIFWPGRQWHWAGDRFTRTLDEVSLNLVGGGPQGLVGSHISTGFSFDHYAIRGDFDLLSLALEGTEVRYYSGWIEGAGLQVYPKIVAAEPVKDAIPNPLAAIAQDLPNVGP